MESSHGSNSPAPFLIKTYEMVDDQLTNSIVSWSHSGCSFVVWNPPEFSQHLLSKYFKHNNFSSFVRQLNTYGFRKIDPDQWEFANEEFMRGQRHLLSNIRRRKPIHSHSLQNEGNTSALTDFEKGGFKKKIKQLKHDKILLQMELQRTEEEKQTFKSQIMSLGERLASMERRQMLLLSCVAQLTKKPGFESILMKQSGYQNKKRRLPEANCFHREKCKKQDQSLSFLKDNSGESYASMLNFESAEKLESSIKCLENILYGARENSAQDSCSDFPPCLLTFQQVSALSFGGDTCSPRSLPCSSLLKDIPPYPEPTASINHIETVENTASLSEPDGAINDAEQQSTTGKENPNPPSGVNDHFWEYFLTEVPGSSNIHESENHPNQAKTNDDRTSDRHWWNANSIHDLTKHLQYLTPAEKTRQSCKQHESPGFRSNFVSHQM